APVAWVSSSSSGEAVRPEEQFARLASGRGDVADSPDELEQAMVDPAFRRERPDRAAPEGHGDLEQPGDERVARVLQAGSLHVTEAVQAEANTAVHLRDSQFRGPGLHLRRSLAGSTSWTSSPEHRPEPT